MDALVHWRAITLRTRVSEGLPQITSSFPSPLPTIQRYQQREPIVDQQTYIRSQSEPPSVAEVRKMEEEDKAEAISTADGKAVSLGTNGTKKPTSSSWVQWWSRSRKRDTNANDTTQNVKKVNGVLDSVRIHSLILH